MVHYFIWSTSLFHSTVSACAVCTLSSPNSPLNFLMLFIPVTGLDAELEELIVEGFLLQVTLPETEQLYRYLLYKLAPPPSQSAPCGNSTEQSPRSPRGSPHHNKVVTLLSLLLVL